MEGKLSSLLILSPQVYILFLFAIAGMLGREYFRIPRLTRHCLMVSTVRSQNKETQHRPSAGVAWKF